MGSTNRSILLIATLIVFLLSYTFLPAQVGQIPQGVSSGTGSGSTAEVVDHVTHTSGALTQTILASAPVGTYRFTGGITTLANADNSCALEVSLSYTQDGAVYTILSPIPGQADVTSDDFGFALSPLVFTTSDVGDITLYSENNAAACSTWNYRLDYVLESF